MVKRELAPVSFKHTFYEALVYCDDVTKHHLLDTSDVTTNFGPNLKHGIRDWFVPLELELNLDDNDYLARSKMIVPRRGPQFCLEMARIRGDDRSLHQICSIMIQSLLYYSIPRIPSMGFEIF